MKHMVPHDLDLDMARKVTGKALESYKERFAEYNPEISWKDERTAEVAFRAKGISLKGLFSLADDAIEMDMDVPFMLRMFQKKAVDVVEREIHKWIDLAKKGEL